ncbi:ATP-binding protein [Zoogloea sp.]|uniref:hybrid sensor histidine kinase/response regulator n=1 Tax=Zoogloea sp. TaxID=49181 RepID=UPI0035B311E6
MPSAATLNFHRLRRRIRDLPIKHQVVLIAFATTALALVVSLVCLVAGELDAAAAARHESAERLTRLVGLHSADALTRGTPAMAAEMLAALGTDRDVIAVTVHDAAGQVFARYRSPLPGHADLLAAIDARHANRIGPDVPLDAGALPLLTLADAPFLEIARPIHAGRERIGTIETYFDLTPLNRLIRGRVIAAVAVLLAAALLAWLLAARLQRLIAAPVEDFASHIRKVTHTGDYSVRATPVGRNEIGTLMHGFNTMLDQIQAGHSELQAARDAAEEASRAKSLFLATMSHEIRNPMHGVIGMADLLAFTRLDDAQQQILRHIRMSADGLMRVINDILDFSKLEAARMDVEAVWCSPRNIVEDTAAFFQFQAADKGLVIRCHIAADLPASAKMDPIRLRQILGNLIANALKFTSGGEVVLRVDHRPLEGNDDAELSLFHFSVRDSGIGIDPAVLPRLFTPFTQADSSYARRFGGTGLGLAICQQLVDLMGGEIGVESTPGKGSDFWFTLSAPVQSAASEPSALLHPLDTRGSAAQLAGLRVLVADDDRLSQVLATAQLEQLHCEVTTAANGTEVLALLDRCAFDLILMDGQMPGLDGYETTRRIRDLERQGRLPQRIAIVAVTGEVAERTLALDCGMDDFLAKPYSQAALRDVLMRHRPRSREATPEQRI